MAITGFQKFQEHFKDFPDCYTIIGGTACDILMQNVNTTFRATKDIDMILLLEARSEDFVKAFWKFIKDGNYKCGWRGEENPHFYRFTEPDKGYPLQIELFSRLPDYHLEAPFPIIPIHVSDDVSSLSAIMLNDEFYHFMLLGRTIVDNVCILRPEYLIPFKMYAWLNLRQEQATGRQVNSRDIKKHKNDVFRLTEIIGRQTHVTTSGLILETVRTFLSEMEEEELRPADLQMTNTKEEALQLIQNIFLP